MSTYIFAIGGSGARVLRSLTMLLASGAHNTAVNEEIVVSVIDYDTTNGDTTRTQTLMELYHGIHGKAYERTDTSDDNTPIKEHFFCTPLLMLRDKADTTQQASFEPKAKFNLYLDTATTHSTFAQYIGYKQLNAAQGNYETRQLLESLYATDPEYIPGTKDDNPKAELYMNLHKGFRGCPNLGCIVTQQLQTSRELNLAVNSLIQPTDKIIIIGSVFGGTGASGIPMFLDFLNNKPNTAAAKKAVIAIMPYFSLTPPDTKSSISSDTFIAKAKAAIGAYDGTVNKQAQCFYYVGDESSNAYSNFDGDANQRNDAHYVELVAGMCVLDFITQNNNGAYECGVKDWQNAGLNYNTFFRDETQIKYLDPILRFKLFSAFWKNCVFVGNSKDNWYIGNSTKGATAIGDSQCNAYRSDVNKFIVEFDAWIKELSDPNTHRPLILCNATSDYKDVWSHIKIERRNRVLKNWTLDDNDFKKNMTNSYNRLSVHMGEGIVNRPEYLFWRGAHDTMVEIENILKKQQVIQ